MPLARTTLRKIGLPGYVLELLFEEGVEVDCDDPIIKLGTSPPTQSSELSADR